MTQLITKNTTTLVSDMYIVVIVLTTLLSLVASFVSNKYVVAVFSGFFVATGILGLAYNKLHNVGQ